MSIVAFTEAGVGLAKALAAGLAQTNEYQVDGIATTQRLAAACGVEAFPSLAAWTAGHFATDDALVFVGACGIAVRAIAPHVADKLRDSAVVCVDERGLFAVPLLSGHVGGANDLARAVAEVTGGQAAISTATDVNGLFAVDEWARENGLQVVERQLAKEVSARLLAGEPVGFARADVAVEGPVPQGVTELAAEGDAPEVGFVVTRDLAVRPFAHTLHLVPHDACVGVGCRRGTDPVTLARHVDVALQAAGIAPSAVAQLATIDLKAEEPAVLLLAQTRGWELRLFSAEQLAAVPGDFAESGFVRQTVGVGNVCERAAAAGGGRLVVRKQAGDGVTVAVAVDERPARFPGAARQARLSIVGLGPGAGDDLTLRARRALQECDLVVGYTVYVDLVRRMFPGKPTLTTGMRREVERCQMALDEAAKGRHVAMVCSGDPGVYGMAGLCLELAKDVPAVRIDVVPGVTAANGGAAVLGAPLMHDFAVISLSDLMTPRQKIRARLEAAAQADLVICLYNPASHKRADYLRWACDVLLAHKSPQTVCGFVRNIGRAGEEWEVTTLEQLRDASVDMFTTVFVGNEATRVVDGRMVTPRGYLQRGRA